MENHTVTLSFPRNTSPKIDVTELTLPTSVESVTQEDQGSVTENLEPVLFKPHERFIDGGNPTIIPGNCYTIELPSTGFFYGDTGVVTLSLIRGKHQSKFTRAAQAGSLRMTKEAVGSTLLGTDIMKLTMIDATYIMYWLRTNSYKKTPLTHTTWCTDPRHLADVADGKLDKDSLRTLDIVTQTDLDVKILDSKLLKACIDALVTSHAEEIRELNAAGLYLTAPLVEDAVLLSELITEENSDSDEAILMDTAVYTRGLKENLELQTRTELVGELSPETTALLQAWKSLVSDYGVTESRQVVCKGCGAVKRAEMLVTAHDFF